MAVATASVAVAVGAPAAHATPVSGPRETVELTFTSVLPHAPVGYHYREQYRNPASPFADPPAVRGMTYTGPGGRIDTLAAPRCTASDAQIKSDGESACQPGSRTGAGTTTVSIMGARTVGDMSIFNGPGQELDVVSFGGHVGAVVRNHYTARGFTNTLDTCIGGGQPPSGCPADQVRVISTDQSARAVVTRSHGRRHSLISNPAVCPRSGYWRSSFVIRFGDGSVDRLPSRHPCTRPVLRVSRRGCRVLRARVTGRDLREVARVDFRVDGRRVARDTRAPYRTHAPLRPGRHVVRAAVYAHGVRVAALRRSIRGC